MHCEVNGCKKAKKHVDIITPDFAGESIAQEIEQPGTYKAIQHVVLKSHGMLVLCDSLRVRDEGLREDLFAMKLASYLVQLHESKDTKLTQLRTPIAIVFTKSDACPDVAADPARFAAANLPRLLQFCDRKFARFRFFASSVVGSSATRVDAYGCRTQVPFHIEPRGVTEPLEWIMDCN